MADLGGSRDDHEDDWDGGGDDQKENIGMAIIERIGMVNMEYG